jgi:citrate lyase beta subunit
VERTANVSESLVARQMMVVIAKAFGLQVIDVVYTEFKGENRAKNL